jgi:hypothetical protein
MIDMTGNTQNGAVTDGIRTLLQLEGVVLFFGPTLFFLISDAPWELYALLFFAPDLGLIGYLGGRKLGAITYNMLHSTIGPLSLALLGVLMLWPWAGPVSLIWFAHIGFDRALGLGLKYSAGFRLTHLGRIGEDDAKTACEPACKTTCKAN